MEPQSLIVITAVVVFVVAALVGALRKQRSWPRLLIDLGIAALTGCFSYYSHTDSHDLAWTVGYGAMALVFLLLALRELRKPGASATPAPK
ncbi:MAG: hypothetical protein U1E76_05845 [Planctomycetota bacterium]